MNKKVIQNCCAEGFKQGEIYGAYKIFFGTLVSDSRLKILNLLRRKDMNVSQLVSELNMDQTHISHDLARLRKCGFVKSTIKGKYRNYSINQETIKPLLDLIDQHMAGNCVHILRDIIGEKENGKN